MSKEIKKISSEKVIKAVISRHLVDIISLDNYVYLNYNHIINTIIDSILIIKDDKKYRLDKESFIEENISEDDIITFEIEFKPQKYTSKKTTNKNDIINPFEHLSRLLGDFDKNDIKIRDEKFIKLETVYKLVEVSEGSNKNELLDDININILKEKKHKKNKKKDKKTIRLINYVDYLEEKEKHKDKIRHVKVRRIK